LVFLNTVKQKRWEMWIGSVLALLTMLLYSLDFLGIVLIFSLLFYSFIIFELVLYIVRCKIVDSSILSASACVYLLLGLVWCYIYALLDYYFPGSILPILETDIFNNFSRYLYFSLVTLTTLGYGDITPSTRIAQNWVVLEAIVGQFYLTILVARLVGLYRSEKR
ncbi:MAG: ion channel, partial [Colwellia sp.]